MHVIPPLVIGSFIGGPLGLEWGHIAYYTVFSHLDLLALAPCFHFLAILLAVSLLSAYLLINLHYGKNFF